MAAMAKSGLIHTRKHNTPLLRREAGFAPHALAAAASAGLAVVVALKILQS
jgi:hypothetical protein